MKYTFETPVQIGDHVYTVDEFGVEEMTVTEVASKGLFVSEFDPPEDDLGLYLPYEDEGDTWFIAKEEAEAEALRDTIHEGTMDDEEREQ